MIRTARCCAGFPVVVEHHELVGFLMIHQNDRIVHELHCRHGKRIGDEGQPERRTPGHAHLAKRPERHPVAE